jgi:hypothetical protein
VLVCALDAEVATKAPTERGARAAGRNILALHSRDDDGGRTRRRGVSRPPDLAPGGWVPDDAA